MPNSLIGKAVSIHSPATEELITERVNGKSQYIIRRHSSIFNLRATRIEIVKRNNSSLTIDLRNPDSLVPVRKDLPEGTYEGMLNRHKQALRRQNRYNND